MTRLRRAPPAVRSFERLHIPRGAFLWLLAAVVAVILPHVLRMPLWLTGLCALCVAGRVLIWQGRIGFPGRLTKLALVTLMVLLLVAQFGRNIFSTDATVGVLLTGITLKLLEMQRKRDVLLVLYLCYFTVIAQFIYSQSIPVALYMGLAVVVITAALMALNVSQDNQDPWRILRYSALVLAQSVPLMLACFLLFPRIAPLWSVPLNTTDARTGLSDSMAPGDIGNLARSAQVVFRVKFEGTTPPFSELYWRALTLDEFDGRRWRRSMEGPQPQFLGPQASIRQAWFDGIEYLGSPVAYNVIMEPTGQNWLYTLQMPAIVDDRLLLRSDFQVQSLRRVNQRLSYDARAWLDWRADAGEEGGAQRRARRLPPEANPRSRELAIALRAQAPDAQAYIDSVLRRFREEEYRYTLNPPLLGADPVDGFLFDTRAGFCEHFASAFTFMMRAAGLPARVVTGYMGGEFNPLDDTLTVRQYDAHAWSEVWLPGRGWIRFDPTAMVAPDRIDQGSNEVLQTQESFLEDERFSLMLLRDSRVLNQLRYRLEMLDYAWNRFVLNYDQDMQFRLFSRLFGSVTQTKILLVVLGVLLLALGGIAALVLRVPARPAPAPAVRCYQRFCGSLARQGLVRAPGETPLQFLQRIAGSRPQCYEEAAAITRLFVDLAYVSPRPDPAQLRELQQRVRRFRRRA